MCVLIEGTHCFLSSRHLLLLPPTGVIEKRKRTIWSLFCCCLLRLHNCWMHGLNIPSYGNSLSSCMVFIYISPFPPSVLSFISTHLTQSNQLGWCRKGRRTTGNWGWEWSGMWISFSVHISSLEGLLTKVGLEEVSEEMRHPSILPRSRGLETVPLTWLQVNRDIELGAKRVKNKFVWMEWKGKEEVRASPGREIVLGL